MNKYVYKAKDATGNKVSGVVEANSPQVAAKLVRERNLVVINLHPAGASIFGLLSRFRGRVSRGDVTTFTRQFATMINAGLPVNESLSILRLQSSDSLKPVVAQILADIEGGDSLSKAMGRHPNIFSPTYIALIKSGEAAGVLNKVLDRLSQNMEKEQEFRGKVKSAMVYPAIIVIGMVIVGLIMMIFVIPRLLALYEEFDAQLPAITKILMSFSSVFSKIWPILIPAALVGIWLFGRWRSTSAGKYQFDAFMLKVPLIGDLQRQIVLTELTRTLALMVGTGVSIVEGLQIAADVSGNEVISRALKEAAGHVEKGFPIAFSFAQHPNAFPYILSQMVAIGEETGQMEEVLTKISHVFEVESEQKVKALTSAVEPLIMVVLGIGVAFLVVAVILPIYNLTTQF